MYQRVSHTRICEAMLKAGYVELDTGRVESLHLGIVPLE